LLEPPVEGVVRVEGTDDGWRTLVEAVERSAVPVGSSVAEPSGQVFLIFSLILEKELVIDRCPPDTPDR